MIKKIEVRLINKKEYRRMALPVKAACSIQNRPFGSRQ
jgi:hypothetical protein